MNTINNARSAPNALQLLLDDDDLAASCATVTHYRQALGLLLKNQFAGTPAIVSQAPTACRLAAPITPSGRAYGLIPEGKSWQDDLINWSDREFRNPADARRIAACWNAFDGMPIELIEADPAHYSMDELKVLLNPAVTPLATAAARPGYAKGGFVTGVLRAEKEGAEVTYPALPPLDTTTITPLRSCFPIGNVAPLSALPLVAIRTNLIAAHDALASTCDSDLDHFETDEEEMEGAPVQYAARKVMQAINDIDPFISKAQS